MTKNYFMNTVTVINEFKFYATLNLVPYPVCFYGDDRKPRTGWRRQTHYEAM
jgi:hypothetical protein